MGNKKSINTLLIESVRVTDTQEVSQLPPKLAVMNGQIRFTCPKAGKVFMVLNFSSEAFGNYDMDAAQNSAQQLVDGRYNPEIISLDEDFYCEIEDNKIHNFTYETTGFIEMFKAVFDNAKWKIPARLSSERSTMK